MKEMKIQEKASFNLQLQNNKKKQKLKEKGITLIALVVTIILLLILAGVTISQIAGSNGLFQRARQAVEKYKNAAEEEQIQIGMLEQYVSDFSVVVGDEGEDKASVNIKEFTVSGDAKNKQITVKLTVEGEASKIQLSIDNGKTWVPSEEELEGTEGAEEETEYTYTFENLDLGKSYYVRVKVYDTEERYVEAISDIVTLSNSITANEQDVLKDKTYLAEDGSVKTGTMPNNGEINATLDAEKYYDIPAGYTSGGKITAKDLASQTQGNATKEQILNGKKAWVNGNPVTGSMENRGTVNKTLNAGESYIIQPGYYSGGKIISGLSQGTFWDRHVERETNNYAPSATTNDLEPGTYLVYEAFALWVYSGGYKHLSGCSFYVGYEGQTLQLNTSGSTFNEITLTKKGKLTFWGRDTESRGPYYWEYFFIKIK